MTINKSKLIGWIGLVVLSLLILFGIFHYVEGRLQAKHDADFNQKQAEAAQKQTELETTVAGKEAERQAAIKQAQDAEAKAADLDAQRAKDRAAIQLAQAQANTFKAQYAKEHSRYVAALAASNSANLDPCTQWTLNCEKSKKLGLLPPDKSCLCGQIR